MKVEYGKTSVVVVAPRVQCRPLVLIKPIDLSKHGDLLYKSHKREHGHDPE
jgi:hypothetical protein